MGETAAVTMATAISGASDDNLFSDSIRKKFEGNPMFTGQTILTQGKKRRKLSDIVKSSLLASSDLRPSFQNGLARKFPGRKTFLP